MCFLVSFFSFGGCGTECASSHVQVAWRIEFLVAVGRGPVSFPAGEELGKSCFQPLETAHIPCHLDPFFFKISNGDFSKLNAPCASNL